MKRILSLLFVVAFAIILVSCQGRNSKNTEQTEVIPYYVGVFQGVLPCADCPGINTSLTLNADSTFALNEKYGDSKDTTIYGDYEIYAGGQILNLFVDSGLVYIYEVGANGLIMLDADGHRIEGELASHYVLTKK